MTSQNLASKAGSLESLKVRVRWGLNSFWAQSFCTVLLLRPAWRAMERTLQRGPGGRGSDHLAQDHLNLLRVKPAGPSRPGLIAQARQAGAGVTVAPLAHRVN